MIRLAGSIVKAGVEVPATLSRRLSGGVWTFRRDAAQRIPGAGTGRDCDPADFGLDEAKAGSIINCADLMHAEVAGPQQAATLPAAPSGCHEDGQGLPETPP